MTNASVPQSALFRLSTRICAALVCALGISANANIITVTNTNDSGPGSLRQALVTAHGGDTINFAVTGAIVLTSGGLVIDKEVTISGPGSDQLSIDGNHAQFQCVFGIAADNTVTISGLTITNGACGIYSDHATLAVSNCVVTRNNGESSVGGIGINDVHGPAAPIERGNPREAYADHPAGFATLTVANSIISDNSGSGVGNVSAAVTIINSTISGNGNSGGQFGEGGGIYTDGGKLPGDLTVINSTVSGNFAFYDGGGIYCGFSGLTVVNSTISNNSAGDFGGGILSGFSSSSSIANSTMSGNSAGSGGGIYNGGTLEVYCTILNTGASGENIFNEGGMVTSHGYNISSDNGSGLLTGPGDQINTDPLLGRLQNNGGPTLTHLPSRGSPAIDAGDPNFMPPPLSDQRGACFRRVFGPRIDVGSVETQPRRRCATPAPRPIPH